MGYVKIFQMKEGKTIKNSIINIKIFGIKSIKHVLILNLKINSFKVDIRFCRSKYN